MNDSSTYKVVFINQGQVYEIYCRKIMQSNMYGFVEIEELVFGERTQVLVDPAEEKLKGEFEGVERSYIPMHSVIRIDEVKKEGIAKISKMDGDVVTPFPVPLVKPTKDK